MKKIGKLIYCAMGAALLLTGCGKKDTKTKANFALKSESSYFYVYDANSFDYFVGGGFDNGLNQQVRYDYEYDKKGNLVEEKLFYYAEEIFDYFLCETNFYEYDEKNRLVKEENFYYTFDGEVDGRSEAHYEYDDHDNVTSVKYYEYSYADNYTKPYLDDFGVYSYEYDENGNITKEVRVNKIGDTYIHLYTYDASGRVLSCMEGYSENLLNGYSYDEKCVYTYFEGSDSLYYKTYTEYDFENGGWVEDYRYEAEMDEEGYIYKESKIEDDITISYWEVEKVSDTKIVEKSWDLDSYDEEEDKAEYVLEYVKEIEYLNHEELLVDGSVVSYSYTIYFENTNNVYYKCTYLNSYDEYGNYLGCEDVWFVGDNDSWNDLSMIGVYYESCEYIEIK